MGKFNKERSFGGGRPFGNNRGGFGGGRREGGRPFGERPPMHQATCGECGQSCEVPFRPTGDRPVFCSNCFKKQGGGRPSNFGGGSFKREDKPRFGSENQMHDAVCVKCGEKCQVPFRPAMGKPVYCDSCFGKNGGKGGVDYTDQFKKLNEKLDKLIGLLSNTTPTEKTPDKKVEKELKKIIKTKTAVKKPANKKKK